MAGYETNVTIPSFAGINQSGDGYNQSMRYAREMENVRTTGGIFMPMRAGVEHHYTLNEPIRTLAYLPRRWAYGEYEDLPATGTLLVAFTDSGIWVKAIDNLLDNTTGPWKQAYAVPDESDNSDETEEETEEESEEETEEEAEEESDESSEESETHVFHGGAVSWLTYEVNTLPDGTASPTPVDVLIFSNQESGMFMLRADEIGTEDGVVYVETDEKFGVIVRYNERIWGTAIAGDPDKLMYSAPYDPTNWEANTEIPEDGAGEIMLPTWDGDSLISLKQVGSNLVVFKNNSIWQLYGTNPGEFTIRQQYGAGTIEAGTVGVTGQMVYMLGHDGLMRHDGTSTVPYHQDALKDIMKRMTGTAKPFGAMRGTTYCLAVPLDGSSVCNAVIEYDTLEYSFALRTGLYVSSFLEYDGMLFYTSAYAPGKVFEMRDDKGLPLPTKWVSGYQDLGLKNSTKSAFLLYMTVDTEVPFDIILGMRTEKKLKQKTVTVKPGKPLRVHLNNKGRYFRLEIQCYSAIPFSIMGGARIDLELDPD